MRPKSYKKHKNPLWMWSGYHLKNCLSPKKTKKAYENRKNLKFEKKQHSENNYQIYC